MYVSKLKQDVQQKETIIQERDNFISKTKEYICKKEGELNEQIRKNPAFINRNKVWKRRQRLRLRR